MTSMQEIYMKAWAEALEKTAPSLSGFLDKISSEFYSQGHIEFAESVAASHEAIKKEMIEEILSISDDDKCGIDLVGHEVSPHGQDVIYNLFADVVISKLCPEENIKLNKREHKKAFQKNLIDRWIEPSLDVLREIVSHDDGKEGTSRNASGFSPSGSSTSIGYFKG